MKQKQLPSKFKFRNTYTIGASAAEDDSRFLLNCFIDKGELAILKDSSNPKRIVLGRTGSGKTALIRKLSKKENSIVINPEDLSLNYISNSDILVFFLELGVNLDLFMKLLWRHVFTVELIKAKYQINSEEDKNSFFETFRSIFIKDKSKERAVNYLQEWGGKFWKETDSRIKEITSQIEDALEAGVRANISPEIGLNLSESSKLSEIQKQEIVQRGQSVINQIHMKELSEVLRFLDEEIFSDEQQKYYICIDKLDENWVDDKFYYLLIRGLIETVRDFQKVRNVKIVVALRNDLIDRVFKNTRDRGYQEEKYRSLYANVKWSPKELESLLNNRVNFLIREKYTTKPVYLKDVLPKKINKQPSIKYMIDRTLLRPRELIEFFNLCIEHSDGKPNISITAIRKAEETFSRYRLRSLQDEWNADYPTLIKFVLKILRKKEIQFKVGDIDKEDIENFLIEYSLENPDLNDEISLFARKTAEETSLIPSFINKIFYVFYKTGVVGLKHFSYEGIKWSHIDIDIIPDEYIDNNTLVKIHPMFWRILGVAPKHKKYL